MAWTGSGWSGARAAGYGVTAPAPGWYPAPGLPGQLRWWDGRAWAQYYQPAYFPGVPGRPPLRAGAAIYGWAIWLVTFLPYTSLVLELAWTPSFRYQTVTSGGEQIPMLDVGSFLPFYFAILGSSVLSYGAAVWIAYVDMKKLEEEGLVRPFHWAWAFLMPMVYVIGRSVIVQQVARRGLAPVWVLMATFVASYALMIIKAMSLIPSLAPTVAT